MKQETIQRRKLAAGTLFLLAGLLPSAVPAQAFPHRAITIVVPYATGGTLDLIVRIVAQPLQRILGQPVVVDTKPGGSGVIATRLVSHAPADGYTLLAHTSALVITPHINKAAGTKPLQDLEPIGLLGIAPMVLVTSRSLPARNVGELIEYAKANPGKINFGSSGPDSYGRLATEKFMHQAGIGMAHVPYKGVSPIVAALMTGEVQLMLSSTTPQVFQLVKDGRLNMLGVAALEPSPVLPGVQPIARTLKGFEVEVWYGLLAPRGTPPEVVAKIQDALTRVLVRPEVKAAFQATGVTPKRPSGDDMRARMEAQSKEWEEVAARLGVPSK